MAVKGSVHYPMKLVPHRPLQQAMRTGLLVTGVIVGLIGSYYAGVYSVRQAEISAVQSIAGEHQQVIDKYKQDITKLQTNAEVDRQTIEQMRKVVATQKAQLASADRDLHVYKDLLSPNVKTNPLGISVGTFTATPLAEAGHFSYKVVVQKLSTKEVDFSGVLDIKIIGQQEGKEKQLLLSEVSPQLTTASIPLTFKYFQNAEGEIQLPADFTPHAVELTVKADKSDSSLVTTQLDWLVSSLELN